MDPTEYNNEMEKIISLVDKSDQIKILFIMPESAGDIFLSTSLLQSLQSLYDNPHIYFACKPQYFDLLKNNPYIHKAIPYSPLMENQIIMEGTGDWQGIFDISIMVPIFTQRHLNYLNNGIGRIAFNVRANHASN
jgi:hypothetical protein